MGADNPEYATLAVRALGAAVLQTWGCPTITPGQGLSIPSERLADVGVVFAGQVMVDDDGSVHNELCPSAHAARPVRFGQLLGPWGPALRHCICRGGIEAFVATDEPLFVVEVKRLISRLESACRSCQPFPLSPVEGEMDTVDAARQILKALADFRDVVVAPPGFSQVVDAVSAAFEVFVADGVRRLQRDGLRRLAEALAARVDSEATALAENLVPHGSGSVACVLVGIGRLNAGVVEASELSVVRQGQLFLEEDTAVVVVPRRLAVLLQAVLGSRVADVMDGTVALCRPVDALAPRLREVGTVTLQLMADGRTDAATAWDAALAASA